MSFFKGPRQRLIPTPVEFDYSELGGEDDYEVLRQNAFENKELGADAVFVDRLDTRYME